MRRRLTVTVGLPKAKSMERGQRPHYSIRPRAYGSQSGRPNQLFPTVSVWGVGQEVRHPGNLRAAATDDESLAARAATEHALAPTRAERQYSCSLPHQMVTPPTTTPRKQ